jgi:hypothetical protein
MSTLYAPHERQTVDEHTPLRRIDRDHYERSPSCDAFTLAVIFDCPNAHTAGETHSRRQTPSKREVGP